MPQLPRYSGIVAAPHMLLGRAQERFPRSHSRLATVLGCGALFVLVALLAAISVRTGPVLILAAGVLIAAWVAGIQSWRRSLICMLLYLPFSGLLSLALYPSTSPGALAKDILFVLPAYAGVAIVLASRRERLEIPTGTPLFLFVGLALLVVAEAFNPALPKQLVGAIGAKVWLMYLPLLWLGYHLFDERAGLQRLLKTMLVIAMIPCIIGILEAILIASGHKAEVYRLYGPAAASATQDFADQYGGTTNLTRIPSIFSFTSQYWLFTTATIAIGYAAWRGNRSSAFMSRFGPLAIGIAVLASVTSGLRAAFIFTPLLLAMMGLLDGARISRTVALFGGGILGGLIGLTVLNVPIGPLASLTTQHGSYILGLFGQGFHVALQHLLGLGSGADTSAARYAFPTGTTYQAVGGVWWESWYVQTFLELGLAGLIVLVLLLASLIRTSLRLHARIDDRELRSMSAAFAALFIWNVIYSVKTAYVEFDPMSTYMWLFLGVQWRLVRMQRGYDAQVPESADRPLLTDQSNRTSAGARSRIAARSA